MGSTIVHSRAARNQHSSSVAYEGPRGLRENGAWADERSPRGDPESNWRSQLLAASWSTVALPTASGVAIPVHGLSSRWWQGHGSCGLHGEVTGLAETEAYCREV